MLKKPKNNILYKHTFNELKNTNPKMKTIIKYTFLPFLLTIPILMPSCSEDMEPDMPVAGPSEQNKEFSDYKELEITINIDSINPSTRCVDLNQYQYRINGASGQPTFMGNWDFKYGVDQCSNNFNELTLDMIILQNGETINRQKLLSGGSVQSVVSNPYILSIVKNTSSITLTMKFPNGTDPSKIEFLFSAAFTKEKLPRVHEDIFGSSSSDNGWNYDYFRQQVQSPQFYNSDLVFNDNSTYVTNTFSYNSNADTNKTFIYGGTTDLYCTYFKRHKISETNDWNSLNKNIVLKRLNSEIFILTEQNNYSIYGLNGEGTSEILAFLASNEDIFETNKVDKIASGIRWRSGQNFGTGRSFFYPVDNKIIYATTNPYDNSGAYYTKRNGWEQWFSTTYNGRTYWAFNPVTLLSTENKSYPINYSSKEEIKYIMLGLSERFIEVENDHFKEEDGDHVHWTVLPLPEGGLQANKRYVYILKNGFNMWQNTTTAKDVRNQTRSSNDVKVADSGFEIIEMDI